MTTNSNEYVGRALTLLRTGLAPFATTLIARHAKDIDLTRFRRFLDRPIADMDVSDLLALMETAWADVFQRTLSRTDRSLVVELRDYRNRWAHQDTISWRDADRALDSCERLLRAVGADEQAQSAAAERRAMACQLDQASAELIAALRRDDVPRVREVVELGADVNHRDRSGYTPLMWAGSSAATRALVAAGAEVNARDRQGHTPLMWVISKSSVPADPAAITTTLIEAGADCDLKDHEGKTASDWASVHRNRLREPQHRRAAEQLLAVLAGERSEHP